MSEDALLKLYGPPLNIYQKDDGTTLYEYVERFQMNGQTVEARRYHFTIKNGKLVSKRITIRNQPAYEPLPDGWGNL